MARVRNPDRQEWTRIAERPGVLGGTESADHGIKQGIGVSDLELVQVGAAVALPVQGREPLVSLDEQLVGRREPPTPR